MTLRFKLPPGGDVPPTTAARRMGLSLDAFRDALPELVARGFPRADETTGNFDLDAIDAWRRNRNPHLFHDHLNLSEDSLNLNEDSRRSPSTGADPNEVIRQKIIAGLTPAKDP